MLARVGIRVYGHRGLAGLPNRASHVQPLRAQREPEPLEVYFKSQNVTIQAFSGENILEVAAKAGYDIPSSCLSGQCGACEVEVTKTDRVTGAKSSGMVRSCIAGFPPGYSRVEVEDLADAIWGADGMDM